MSDTSRTIKVDALARVEGEGALHVSIKDDQIEAVKFRIFEPPRFFEAFLQGRHYSEVPDITARICGICPIAYMMGASQAMENSLGIEVSGDLQRLRRLIYCGEWIESHVLHAAMLHAPDFLGLDDALQIAKQNPELVNDALQLKKLGNDIMDIVGGRAVHPVNMKVGGFYKAPKKSQLEALLPRLEWALESSRAIALAFAEFDYPDLEQDYTCVSLQHPEEYAINRGQIVSNRGLVIDLEAFLQHFSEEHVAHSNALQGSFQGGKPYLVGPIARYNNTQSQPSDNARQLAAECGLGAVVNNPYKSILVRMIETYYACEESIRLIQEYQQPEQSSVEAPTVAGEGYGCTEAPRGICFHRYQLDSEGLVKLATIVPPTAQNQKQIEEDLRAIVEKSLEMPDDQLTWRCEQTIRNYDPCISCATHFLKLTIERN
ncbi:MAG: Ni/Fe hydrogenase subunit alpha [Chromatiales bacterium]|nr:Ni/Fe hydrogenase subunit alpha [Chromatiales bacterium]